MSAAPGDRSGGAPDEGAGRAPPPRRERDAAADGAVQVRVVLPEHLRTLARVGREVALQVARPVTLAAVLDALEAAHPVLRGAVREHATHRRRAFVRFFAAGRDVSHEPPDSPLPSDVAEGREPFVVVGAMAGG